jgi:RNA polymerase sigma-70 factor, ECF subfamily
VIDSADSLSTPADQLKAREAEEVRLAKAGDAVVWSAWYDRYYPILYRYAYARLGQRQEAEDVAAQTFLRAIEAIGRFRYKGKPVLAWLYRIAGNLVTDRHRRAAKVEGSSVHHPPVAEDSVDSLLDSIDVRRALERLTDEQRDVLILRFAVGLTSREAAALLGKSEAAIYSLQVRATAALRRFLSAA